MSEENTVVETTETTEVIEETQPLSSWESVDVVESADAPDLMRKAIEVGTKAATEEVTKDTESTVQEEVKEEKEEAEAKEEVTRIEDVKGSKIKVKVNGKEEEVSIEELKSNYSGKVAYDKKFTELDKERKTFLNEKTQIENYVNEFRTIAQSQNMVEATKFLGQITGKGPHEVVNELINALAPEIERRYGLTDEELDFENKKAEFDYQKQKLETERNRLTQEKSQGALQAKIDEIMSSHKISAEDWNNAIHTLDSRLPKDEVITPELVSEYITFERANTTTESVLESYNDGKFAGDEEVIKGLREIILENPDFTNDDLVEILNDALKTTQTKQVEEKLSKKVSSKTTTTKKEDAPTISTPVSWDDIL